METANHLDNIETDTKEQPIWETIKAGRPNCSPRGGELKRIFSQPLDEAVIFIDETANQIWSLGRIPIEHGDKVPLADSDEVAQAFRFDGAQDSDLKPPSFRSLAGR